MSGLRNSRMEAGTCGNSGNDLDAWHIQVILLVANNTGLWICGTDGSPARIATRGMGEVLRILGWRNCGRGRPARVVAVPAFKKDYDSSCVCEISFPHHSSQQKIAQLMHTDAGRQPPRPDSRRRCRMKLCQKPEKLPVRRLLRQFQSSQGCEAPIAQRFFARLPGEMLRDTSAWACGWNPADGVDAYLALA